MKQKQSVLLIFSILCMMLGGCKNVQAVEPVQLNLVRRVDVSYRKDGVHLQRSYTSTDKIDAILFYLYRLVPLGKAQEDPERITNDSCKITVITTGGQTHVYRQRGGRYLSVDCKPWQKIDPEKTESLFPLLARLCSDEI